jgi:hypothetical protein
MSLLLTVRIPLERSLKEREASDSHSRVARRLEGFLEGKPDDAPRWLCAYPANLPNHTSFRNPHDD